jgi:alkylation response protein AidB-like acyl-CoA dehydrogenase
MDFELDNEQRLILESVERLLVEHAGPARAIELQREGAYDARLDTALGASGFDRLAQGPAPLWLETALVAIAIARAAGVTAFTAGRFVLPGATGGRFVFGDAVLALVDAQRPGPVRYATAADVAVVLDADRVRCFDLGPGTVRPVRSNYGFPIGVIDFASAREKPALEIDADDLRRFWRLGLVLETVGAMSGALETTVAYLKERRQFGRPLGSFQAVQHRLAECAIAVEGSRWLALEAAHGGAPAEASAVAASFAIEAAERVFADTHQLSGAIGFTHEHDLHVWSMRLQALRLELGGLSAHNREVARLRWGFA